MKVNDMNKKTYNKLVRDKIPEICANKGIETKTEIISSDKAYLEKLLNKLIEEAHEVKQDPSAEELADVLEVVMSTAKTLGLSLEEIEKVRLEKLEKRGGFDKKIFLISTEEKSSEGQ